jgi:hypothetical protein
MEGKLPELQKAAEELRANLSPNDLAQLTSVIQGEFMQKQVLDSEPVKEALDQTKLDRSKAEDLAGMILLAQNTGNNSEVNYLQARVASGEEEAKKELYVANSINQVVAYFNQQVAAQQQQEQPADVQK